MPGTYDHGTRWIAVVIAAFAVSIVLRAIAHYGTRRGETKLAGARRALADGVPHGRD